MTDSGATAGSDPDPSIPVLNLDLERTRLEFQETVRAIEERVNVRARYRRWRARADRGGGADRAFPVAIVAGAAIAVVALVGVIGAVRTRDGR